MHVITRNINITRLQANTSRRIKRCSGCYLWPPLSLRSPTVSYDNCRVRMHPVVRMRGIVPANVGSESCELTKTVEYKRFYLHNPYHSAWPWWWRENSFEKTESLTQRSQHLFEFLGSPSLLWLWRCQRGSRCSRECRRRRRACRCPCERCDDRWRRRRCQCR